MRERIAFRVWGSLGLSKHVVSTVFAPLGAPFDPSTLPRIAGFGSRAFPWTFKSRAHVPQNTLRPQKGQTNAPKSAQDDPHGSQGSLGSSQICKDDYQNM